MSARFNPPPGWPQPPAGWVPPAGWQPDPSWPAPPAGWPFWVDDAAGAASGAPTGPKRRSTRGRRVAAVVAATSGAAVLVLVAGLQAARGAGDLAPTSGSSRDAASATQSLTRTPSRPASPSSTSTAPTTSSAPTAARTTASSVTTQQPPAARPGTALAALAAVRVAGRAPRTGYARAQFGPAWSDVDRNGCDTRNDVLRRDLKAYTLRAGTHGCLVLKGTLHDPYTGRTIAFVRGQSTSTAVQIDHVVALSDAWQKGAQRWTSAKRTAFANDSLNLLAVDGPTNARKSDGDAATWLPPARSYRCAYVARQEAVKLKYGLWMTRAERDAVARVLSACPQQRLPAAVPFRLGGGTVQAAPAPQPTPKASMPSSGSGSHGGTDPRYGTCKEANAHGYGPYYAGRDPEYAWYQDRDHDGVVCE